LGFSGGGIGAVLLGRALIQPPGWQLPELKPETVNDPGVEFNVATIDAFKKTITVERKNAEFRTENLSSSVTLDLILIPGGSFTMGSPDSELGRSDEGPQREVNVSAFLMGKYPVTQAQWKAVAALPKIGRDLDADPANFKGDNLPVEQVRWDDAIEFCQRLSKQTGREYRLPSEAEWEYACRAETTTPFHFGETITTDLANYDGSSAYGSGPKGQSRGKTTAVGSFKIANAFGLYDMHGNVREWCLDHWHDSYEGAPTDGSAWTTGGDDASKVLRGGSWDDDPRNCRSANRLGYARDYRFNLIGFRLVCASSWALT
jgi:formylglycine-generating enzyme required for sulfatase activity